MSGTTAEQGDANRLTERQDWDAVHGRVDQIPPHVLAKAQARRSGWHELLRPYHEEFLWNVILERHLHLAAGARVLEVGSAPGHFLVRLNKTYGVEPYGVEYSLPGVKRNRQLFALHKLPVENVVHADFFSPEFHARYAASFDLVVSRGFIEHFKDVPDVLAKHVALLRPGGYLLVTIPNLGVRSVYGQYSRYFDRPRLDRHNTAIMAQPAFAELFARPELSPLYCGYYGAFDLGMLSAGTRLATYLFFAACVRLQRILNPLLWLLCGTRRTKSAWLSPGLVYLGKARRGEKGV